MCTFDGRKLANECIVIVMIDFAGLIYLADHVYETHAANVLMLFILLISISFRFSMYTD